MKTFFKSFFKYIFTDYETMYTPHADAKTFMNSYITFEGDTCAPTVAPGARHKSRGKFFPGGRAFTGAH